MAKGVFYLGIDPGMNGGSTLLDVNGDLVYTLRQSKTTFSEQCENLPGSNDKTVAVIERVSAMPGNGVSSMFKFGMAYGISQGILISQKIPYQLITPVMWQREFIPKHKETKTERKRRLKEAAHQLFPDDVKAITLENADSVLIAAYCYRLHNGLLVKGKK